MSAIKGIVELFRVSKPDSNRVKEYVDLIEQSADQMLSMMKSITKNVRIRKFEKDVEVDLNKVIKEVIQFKKYDKRFKDINLLINLFP